MKISFAVLIYNGLSYSRENPGIAIVDYGGFLGWEDERTDAFWDRVRLHFAEKSHIEFCYDTYKTTTIEEIVNEIVVRVGFDSDAVSGTATQTYIFVEEEFVQIRKPKICIGDIEKYYHLDDSLEIFLVLSSQAGAIWNDEGLRYFMNSKESGSHHIPHVHVDYKHEACASISLIDASVLEGSLPSKVLKRVKRRVTEEQTFLLRCWEKNTDGFRVNLNYSFGITPLKLSD